MYLTSAKSGTGPTTHAHEFINYELGFDPNNPYIPIKEDIISVLDARDDATENGPIEEANNVWPGDVVVDRVGFKGVKSVVVTLKQTVEHYPTDVTPLI